MNGIAHSIRSISSSVLLLLAISAHAATVWNGPTISFTKSNNANPLLAQNQDRLTTNVWITRGSSQGLFNANTESRFTHYLSPAGTEWANGSLENYATLIYTNWNHWAKGVNPNPYATVGVQAVVHLIADDIYLSVQFTSWSGGAPGGGPTSGGGFSYLRSTPVPEPQVNYAISGSTAYVTRSPNASGDIVIASTFNGYPVTSIGHQAFSNSTSLTSVTIPHGVTNIGFQAFRDCWSLTSVTIGNGVTSIGSGAFSRCPSLTNLSVDAVNPAYSSLDEILFNKAQTTLLTYPAGRAGSYVIPNSVTRIEQSAFSDCTSLTSVTMGNSVTSIADYAFYGCRSMTSATIGNSITSIGSSAFEGCRSLTSVTIPDSVIGIGWFTFYACTNLTSVTIGNSLTSIAGHAFDGCTSLTSLIIGNSVTSIGSAAFQNCTALTSVTIPDSVTYIHSSAFDGCTSLTSVIIPNSVTRIDWYAFRACTSLTSVTIPDSVADIMYGSFLGCTSLTNLSVDAANPVYSSLDGVLFDKAQATLVIFPSGRAGSYVIPDSVTSFGYQAFGGCTSLTSVTIPASVTSIGSVFWQCASLTNVTFLGNAPTGAFFGVGPGATVYYYCGTTGWGATYGGFPTVMLFAPIAPGSAGVKPGGFGFTVVPCLTNQTIVVEASTNLANWQPIWTNPPPGTSTNFVDPEWLNHSNRFYRARSD
jgi:hypothetical protein